MQLQRCRTSLHWLACVLLLARQACCTCTLPPQTFDLWPQPVFQVINSLQPLDMLDPELLQVDIHPRPDAEGLLLRAVQRFVSGLVQRDALLCNSTTTSSSSSSNSAPSNSTSTSKTAAQVDRLRIVVGNIDQLDLVAADESYQLTVSGAAGIRLTAPQPWGALKGLASLAQLTAKVAVPTPGGQPTSTAAASSAADHPSVAPDPPATRTGPAAPVTTTTGPAQYFIAPAQITDSPRFKFRGLLLDSSRHFLPMDLLRNTLDTMAQYKFNALHWHIVDDNSFPLQLARHPELAAQGAYEYPAATYSHVDVRDILAYARDRGIRVVPEIDTPGHTLSWGASHPEVLTHCRNTPPPPSQRAPQHQAAQQQQQQQKQDLAAPYASTSPAHRRLLLQHLHQQQLLQQPHTGRLGSGLRAQQPYLGPLDPSKEGSYQLVQEVLEEVSQMFPDPWLHLGGDEVDYDCWKSDPELAAWMAAYNITSYRQLQSSYMARVQAYTFGHLKRTPLVWQEVYDDGADLPRDSVIIHVWKKGIPPSSTTPAAAATQTTTSRTTTTAKRTGRADARSKHIIRETGPAVEDNKPPRGKGWWQDELAEVVGAGYYALLSSPWYLDQISWGQDWRGYYSAEPLNFTGTVDAKARVLGGAACLWGEYVDQSNLRQVLWPRALAVAERLWSPGHVRDLEAAHERIAHHRCWLVSQGVPAAPLFPGHCPPTQAAATQSSLQRAHGRAW